MLKTSTWVLLGCCVSGLLGCTAPLFTPSTTPGFQLSAGEATHGDPKYYVYVPKDWTADKAWPVVVYLHGSGERGRDPAQPTQTGVGRVVYKSGGGFPAIVVFPQVGKGEFWGMPDTNLRVIRALDEVMSRYHGDPTRVYLTGNSLGGFGTWFMAALNPDRFAALVPICGGVRGKAPRPDAPFAQVPQEQRAKEFVAKIGRTPVWIFHGKKDFFVPVSYSQEMNAALKAGGGDVRYTEYPDLGHQSWDRAYADPALWTWLLAQHR